MVQRLFSILQSLFLLQNEGMILLARTRKMFYSRYIDVTVVSSISAVKCTLVKYSFRHFSPFTLVDSREVMQIRGKRRDGIQQKTQSGGVVITMLAP